jgi:GGDEF domain-containing protein
MTSPVLVENDEPRLEVLSDNYQSPVPREERYDRITRTAMRLLEIPVAFMTTIGEDGQALRSVQGLPAHQTSHALAFCDPQILQGQQALVVPDTAANPLFWHNPLVTGPARVRSFLGVPLQRAPNVPAGVLCAMHVEPRAFRQPHISALQDLARLVEAELRLDTLTQMHRRVVTRLGQLERRGHFDTVTGCWSVRRFRELLSMAVSDAQARGGTLALCYARVKDFKRVAGTQKSASHDALRQFVAHELRQRLPARGALASLGAADFCALLPAHDADAAQNAVDMFCRPDVAVEAAGAPLELAFGRATLHDLGAQASATEIWARALSNLEH